MQNHVSTQNRFAVLSTDNKNATEYSLVHKLRSDIAALRCTLKEQRIDFKEKEDFYLHAVSSEKAYTSKLRNAIKIQKEIPTYPTVNKFNYKYLLSKNKKKSI